MIFPANQDGGETSGRRTRVKICGLTHPDDAALAVELGADALGLNFYPRSARCLDPTRDAAWLQALPKSVLRVGVVVNAGYEAIARLLGDGLVDAVQLHGDEDPAFCRSLHANGVPFIKALRARDASVLEEAEGFHTKDLLIDAYHPGAYGGTGQAVDWKLAAQFVQRYPRTLLAGGLHPGNVGEAIERVHPWGVDVASGTEGAAGPRRKDAETLRRFFESVRKADAETPVS